MNDISTERTKPPSEAQAKRLAAIWGERNSVPVDGYIDATTRVCVAKGWLVPSGHYGEYPNETVYAEHVISTAGLDRITVAEEKADG